MIRRTKQDWSDGKTVNVGFLTLRVLGHKKVEKYLPEVYFLESLDHSKRYEFIPHNGLTRIV